MSNSFRFDKNKYPDAWVFNDEDCALSNDEKRLIIFLDKDQSQSLWDTFFPFEHLMLPNIAINMEYFTILEETRLQFDNDDKFDECTSYFSTKLKDTDMLFFFLDRERAVILPKPVFLKAWSDFFCYIAWDGSILLVPNHNLIIFGEHGTTFGKLIEPLAKHNSP
jgi:hypothetical protein